MKSHRILAALALATIGFSSWSARAAEPEKKPFVDPLFQSNMVLQRDARDAIWGWTDPGKQVTVSCEGKTATATADADGKWLAKIGPLAAGGPFDLTVSGPQDEKLTNVLIGDVWICSGQSNMEFGIHNGNDAEKEIAAADHPEIRLFTVPKDVAYEPKTGFRDSGQEAKWLVCTPKNIIVGDWGGFTAVGYFFGRDLQAKLHIPIGLIHTSWGGTVAQAWTSAKALQQMPDFAEQLKNLPHEAPTDARKRNNPNQVTVLYNGMIAPLIPLTIKGAIWYQGESNAGAAMQYRTLLPTMIRDWRSRLGGGDFPFFIVQLANFMKPDKEPKDSGWAELREAQDMTAKEVGHSAIASAIDIGDAGNIHPKNKQEVGRRLALDALALTYGKDVEYSGPTFTKMDINGDKAVLHFDHLGGGLKVNGGHALGGFAIAGEDKKFVWADARIDGDTVVVSSPDVKKPVAVRYAWGNNPDKANLYNKANLPANPFRTDVTPTK